MKSHAAIRRSEDAPAGRRERNKRDKLQRIQQAARTLFSRQGVDATTIRQIADAADIGLGTVFSYAANKEDLLVLIFQDEVGRVVDRALTTIPEKPARSASWANATIERSGRPPVITSNFIGGSPCQD